MENKFSSVYHHHSKQLKRQINPDASQWPDEWRTVYYKTYPRFPKIALEDIEPNSDLFSALKTRRSRRAFSDAPLSKRELSVLLKYAAGMQSPRDPGKLTRMYPSAGARYPIELYAAALKQSEDIPAGLYHYDVEHHRLDVLWRRKDFSKVVKNLFNNEWYADAALLIFMTGVFWRSEHKYGERAYRFVLIESGHIAQNIYLVAETLSLKCCEIGATRPVSDESVEKLIDIDGVSESLVGTMALGK